jgi:hypothetical protein
MSDAVTPQRPAAPAISDPHFGSVGLAATTLTSAAHGGQVWPAPRRSRLALIVGIASVVLGSTVGSALALREDPATEIPTEAGGEAASAAPLEPPLDPPPSEVAPAVTAPRSGRDPAAALTAQIKDALQRFVAWSHDHPGAPCPDTTALGAAAVDPWGQPLRIVCADQPADQLAGVLSFGPDGVAGTSDDVASWSLGADITEIARGPRWTTLGGRPAGHKPAARPRPPAAAAGSPPPPRPPRSTASTGAAGSDTDEEGIPVRR